MARIKGSKGLIDAVALTGLSDLMNENDVEMSLKGSQVQMTQRDKT